MSAIRKIIIGTIIIASGFAETSEAGTSGSVSGFVRDKETGNSLPGTAVIVENTTYGATADKHGFYIIHNLPVGNYSLRATMIGYIPTKITEVEVKTDLNTPVNFSLTARALQVEKEIVVTAPRIKIYKDEISSVHYIGAHDLSVSLPAQTFQDALPLVPGFVASRFRGGRTSNTLYLIDGLPASGPLTRDLAFIVQNSAIAEMVVQTGGFSAEYGGVSAGLVNIITKEGRNDFDGSAKIATDIVGRKENGFENTRRAEFAVSGPLTLGLGGPVIETNYLISGGMNLSDTPYHEALRRTFKSPVLFNYDVNVKFAIRASKNTYVRLQTLLSDYDWRKYEAQWQDRVSALPKRQNRNLRLSASLIHTLNASTFYKLDLVGMSLQRKVLGDLALAAPANINLPSQSPASAWTGAVEPWNENSVEKQLTAHFSLVRQFHPAHQLKAGLETSLWDLSFNRMRYLLWPKEAKDENEFVYSRYTDSFRQYPFTFAGYLHHKIETSNLILNLGVRYEIFSPNAKQTALPSTRPADSSASGLQGGQLRFKQTFSPRLSLAFPMSEKEHLSVNYGWFYEMPPFYYLYLNRGGDQQAYWPLFGNVDLKPLRSKAGEVIYRREISAQTSYSIAYFFRESEDLLDTFPYFLVSSAGQEQEPPALLRYENSATASMNGVELALKRDFGQGFDGALAYTYLRSLGTAAWPENRLLKLARGEKLSDNRKLPMAWDQRHTLTLNLTYQSRSGILLNILGKINSPATAVDWLSGTQSRLPARHDLDAKFAAPLRWAGLRLEPFVEIHNVLDGKYLAPSGDGLDLSQLNSPLRNQLGRQIWVGLMYR
jgi:outer membrane receptor protein involved in Fe transport